MENGIREAVLKRLSNVNVDKDFKNNVYVDVDDIERINDSLDKHRAIGELLAEKLGRHNNVKLYIKLSYLNSPNLLLECCSIALDAYKTGIANDPGAYFYGIVKNLGKVK